jgi:NTP pyrophosphatase (non-canonical NTP hydrolase)
MPSISEEAIMVANEFAGHYTPEQKVKKLAEEVVELGMAIRANDLENMQEEIGDCVYILLHLAYQKFETVQFDGYIKAAMEKMIRRNSNEESNKH